MQLKDYQKVVIADLEQYLSLLQETHDIAEAYRRFWQNKGIVVGGPTLPAYQNILPGIPCVCTKLPTGGGKTYVACNAVKPIFNAIPVRKAKVVVWLVPSDAILTQTLAALRDPNHPYRQKLDVDFGSSVEVYSKQQLLTGQNFNPTAVNEQLSICVLSYDSFRGRKENLKARQENSNLAEFAKVLGAPEIPVETADDTALLQILNQLSPLVIVDESHHAKSTLSRQMLRDFNPCFVLELTATPNKESNIISFVDAVQLKKENMVKLPVIVYNRDSKDQVLIDTIDLRDKLEKLAAADREVTGRYLRPIALFQAQPKGKEDSTTFQKLKTKLVEIGIPAEQIAIRTADVNEIKNVDLMSEACPIRFIITVNALKEGWDCPFAYILSSLANKTSQVDVEQILGRILRLPYTKKNRTAALNMSYVLTSSNDFAGTLKGIVAGLNAAGFSEKDYRIGTPAPEPSAPPVPPTPAPPPAPAPAPVSPTEPAALTEEPSVEPEEFLDFDPATVASQLSQSQSTGMEDAGNSNVASMLHYAEQTGLSYETLLQTSGDPLSGLSHEVRDKVSIFYVKPEFREEIENLRIPQFVMVTPKSIFSDGTEEVLEKELLSSGFTLKGKPSDIDFASADTEMVMVDVREKEGIMPRVFKMATTDQQLFKEYFSKLPPKDRIERCKVILNGKLNNLNNVSANDLKQYIDRIVSEMTEEQLAGLEKSPFAYSEKVKKKVLDLLDDHYEKQFDLMIETGKIQCRPVYKLPDYIYPTESTSFLGGSLYEAEEEMDGLEQKLAIELTSLSNIRWWHRNIAKREFKLNGFINHYPDFLIMTENGVLVAAETKGDQFKSLDSIKKAKLGRIWQNAAGSKYRYYMVFDDTDTWVDGSKSISEFLTILKNL